MIIYRIYIIIALYFFMASCTLNQPYSADWIQRIEAYIAQTDKEIELIRQGIAESYLLLELHEIKLQAYQQAIAANIYHLPANNGDVTVPPDAEPATASSLYAETQYQEALSLYYQQQYDTAIAVFQHFFNEHQKHDLAVNALYWIGECYYAKKHYQESIVIFKQILDDYPTGRKAPDALLKIGYAYFSMQDYPEALKYLERAEEIGGKIGEKAEKMLARNRIVSQL